MLGSATPIYLLAKAAGTPASGATSDARHYERQWTPIHLDFVVTESFKPGSGHSPCI